MVAASSIENLVLNRTIPFHDLLCAKDIEAWREQNGTNQYDGDIPNHLDQDFHSTFHPSQMRCLALVSHNDMKATMRKFVLANMNVLKKFRLTGTNSTMTMLKEVFKDDPSIIYGPSCSSGPLGGDAELVAQMCTSQLGGVIFFQDPMTSHAHQSDIDCLCRQALVHNTMMVNNPTSALMLMTTLRVALKENLPELIPSFFCTLQSPTVDTYKTAQSNVIKSHSTDNLQDLENIEEEAALPSNVGGGGSPIYSSEFHLEPNETLTASKPLSDHTHRTVRMSRNSSISATSMNSFLSESNRSLNSSYWSIHEDEEYHSDSSGSVDFEAMQREDDRSNAQAKLIESFAAFVGTLDGGEGLGMSNPMMSNSNSKSSLLSPSSNHSRSANRGRRRSVSPKRTSGMSGGGGRRTMSKSPARSDLKKAMSARFNNSNSIQRGNDVDRTSSESNVMNATNEDAFATEDKSSPRGALKKGNSRVPVRNNSNGGGKRRGRRRSPVRNSSVGSHQGVQSQSGNKKNGQNKTPARKNNNGGKKRNKSPKRKNVKSQVDGVAPMTTVQQ